MLEHSPLVLTVVSVRLAMIWPASIRHTRPAQAFSKPSERHAQLNEAIQTASEDTVIEFQGQKKIKAQWRSDFQAKHKPLDISKLKELAAERKTKFEADAKALQAEQDSRIAEQNAQVAKEFDELRSR
jgi:hypothetical protein